MSTTIRMEAGDLIQSLSNVSKNLTKELLIVSRETAKYSKSQIAKKVSDSVNITQKVVKKHLTIATVGKTGKVVDLEKSKRIPLRHFGAKQNKSGVSYRISKRGSRQKIKSAFIGKGKLNGKVFIREHLVNPRSKIRKVGYGPSPWGVMSKRGQVRLKQVAKISMVRLKQEMADRIRYLKLKKSGAI